MPHKTQDILCLLRFSLLACFCLRFENFLYSCVCVCLSVYVCSTDTWHQFLSQLLSMAMIKHMTKNELVGQEGRLSC